MTLDQTRAPFFESLTAERAFAPLSFHMPGHKFRSELLPDLAQWLGPEWASIDVNECSPTVDYLHAPGPALSEAQALAAALAGADETYFLINGATVGNQAMLLAAAREGRKVIVSRAAHRSVFAGLILSGAQPIYVPASVHPRAGLPLSVSTDAIADVLAANPDAAAVHVTGINYYGYLPDMPALVALAHARDLPLLVDEAHGAHLGFHPLLPRSAVQHGADLVVQSPHKTLGALTQAAWLHVSGAGELRTPLTQALALLQSSSPSVLLTGSLDVVRRLIALDGRRLIGRAIALAARARDAIRAIPGLDCYGSELVDPAHGIAAHDPTKLVIDVRESGWTGVQVKARLREQSRVGVEFADPAHVVCSVTLADDDDTIDALLVALRAAVAGRRDGSATAPPAVVDLPSIPTMALTPRQAFGTPTLPVPLAEALGRVCAEQVMPYPPGIPVLLPGEIVGADHIDYLHSQAAHGVRIVGPEDQRLQTLRVIAERSVVRSAR